MSWTLKRIWVPKYFCYYGDGRVWETKWMQNAQWWSERSSIVMLRIREKAWRLERWSAETMQVPGKLSRGIDWLAEDQLWWGLLPIVEDWVLGLHCLGLPRGWCLSRSRQWGGNAIDALMEESIGCLKAPKVATHHRITHIVLETDWSLLTNAIWSTSRNLCPKWDDL